MAKVVLLSADKHKMIQDIFGQDQGSGSDPNIEQLTPTSQEDLVEIMKDFGIVFPDED